MALDCIAGVLDGAGRLTLVVRSAESLYKRLRAGESFTMASLWDQRSFETVDPCGTHVIVEGAGGDVAAAGAGVSVRLPTTARDVDERTDWYSKIGFVLEDEREGPEGEESILVAGPVEIVVVVSPQSEDRPVPT